MKFPLLNYLKYLLRHKYYVFRYSIKEGIVWRGLTHDLSKFRLSELIPYARKICVTQCPRDPFYTLSFLHHKNRNRHHWEYWIIPEGNSFKVYPMDKKSAIEMVCDWRGTQATQGKNSLIDWYISNRERIILHSDTRSFIERMIGIRFEYGKE